MRIGNADSATGGTDRIKPVFIELNILGPVPRKHQVCSVGDENPVMPFNSLFLDCSEFPEKSLGVDNHTGSEYYFLIGIYYARRYEMKFIGHIPGYDGVSGVRPS